MTQYHPRKNDAGQPVEIQHPSMPTAMSNWTNPTEIATVVPDGPMPESVGGIPFRSWANVPRNAAAWEKLAEEATLEEPVFAGKKKPASGVVAVEQDGRVWVVSPTNEFGGYTNTFPKGKLEKVKLSLKANALKEAYEESGLQVELIAYLYDSDRDSSTTRYYLARRIGGNPADMDWESQATSLVPRGQLAKFVSHLNDKAVLDALDRLLPVAPRATDLMKSPHLTSGHRILKTVNGFRQRYGSWPTVLRMDRGMANALKKGTLTATAWAMLEAKLKIVLIDEGTLYAEGNGQRFESGAEPSTPEVRERADIWIWGIPLEELLNEHFDFFSRHYAVHR